VRQAIADRGLRMADSNRQSAVRINNPQSQETCL